MRLAPDYHRQNSADSSSSSCSNMTTQQSHETKPCPSPEQISQSEHCTYTVTSSGKSRCHFSEQRSHIMSEFVPNCHCQPLCNGQPRTPRPRSLECKRRPSSQDDGFLEMPETESDQTNSTVVSPVISVEENQDDETVTIHSMSQISRSPSLTSSCSLSLPPHITGPGGGQMRSLRLFFNDSACTCGQLVVASRESQYKILHFHHGGLDRLATVLQEWNFLLHSPQPSAADQALLPYRHFMVCRAFSLEDWSQV